MNENEWVDVFLSFIRPFNHPNEDQHFPVQVCLSVDYNLITFRHSELFPPEPDNGLKANIHQMNPRVFHAKER